MREGYGGGEGIKVTPILAFPLGGGRKKGKSEIAAGAVHPRNDKRFLMGCVWGTEWIPAILC